MRILAIDTSCDDTAVALVEKQGKKIKILSNVVSSQVKLHQQYGGVFPMLAKREHQRNLLPVSTQALKQGKVLKLKTKNACPVVSRVYQGATTGEKLKTTSQNLKIQNIRKMLKREPEIARGLIAFLEKYQKPNIQAIAATVGPGLEPCLWQGVNFAKALACYWGLPLVPVNHIEAHLAANFVSGNSKFQNSKQKIFPAIGLIVSGGHTQLILIKRVGKYEIIGETRDDAAGECFDKTARILGLAYPGGPAIATSAAKLKTKSEKRKITLPRPMMKSDDFDFSFSGLKTAVLYEYRKQKKAIRESKAYQAAAAKEIQQAIIDVLLYKTLKAGRAYKAKTILLAGGVAANQELRKQFAQKIKKEKLGLMFHVPCFIFCTDNAAMVGISGLFNLQCKKRGQKEINRLKAQPNLRIC